MDGEGPLEPDSTTVEKDPGVLIKQFTVNDDVLCQSGNGDQLYLGNVVQVNQILKKCLVKFFDMTETWCKFQDMKLLNQPEEEVSCVVCKSSQNSVGNQVHTCSCGRGYHQRCHQPHIIHRDTTWRCRFCMPIRRVTPALQSQQTRECVQCLKREVWYRSGMLQCRRCRQWLHAGCLTPSRKLALNGDRFYVMVCSGCNRGHEICCRLSLTWEDLVHLVLFNLNLVYHSKYHDLDSTIIPFLKGVWSELQLPPQIAKYEMSKLRDKLETVLQNCTKRFRSGRETKKRVTLWGLRIVRAPRPPLINLPIKGVIDESLACIRKLLVVDHEPPLQNGHVNSSRRDDERAAKRSTETKVGSSTEFHGRGLVKRSVPFPLTEAPNTADARFRSNAVRRASRMLLLRRKRRRRSPSPRLSDSEDEALRTLESPASYQAEQAKEVRKRPRRNLLEARLNSTENKLYNPKAASTPQPVEPSPKKKGKKGQEKSRTFAKPKKRLLESLSRRRLHSEMDSPSSSDERRQPPAPHMFAVTRRLSARDLIVDEDGRVRRRRRRFRRAYAPPVPPPVPPPVCHAPIVIKAPFWFCDMFTGSINRDVVQDVLGPMARVKRGEPYKVVARRVLLNGQVELLLNFPS